MFAEQKDYRKCRRVKLAQLFYQGSLNFKNVGPDNFFTLKAKNLSQAILYACLNDIS